MRWARCWYSSRPWRSPVDREALRHHGPPARTKILTKTLIPNATVAVGAVRFGNSLPLTLIAGPCQMESRAHALEMATAIKEICGRVGIGLIYKTSFDKPSRTSAKGARALGLRNAMPVFAEVRESLGLPTLTDVHEIDQCAPVA